MEEMIIEPNYRAIFDRFMLESKSNKRQLLDDIVWAEGEREERIFSLLRGYIVSLNLVFMSSTCLDDLDEAREHLSEFATQIAQLHDAHQNEE
jgi:hypothetical protein